MNLELAATRRLADRLMENSNEKSQDNSQQNLEPAFPARYIRFGEFHLDVQRQDLIKNGQRLRVPGKVCQVLIALLEQPGEIVTREDLRARLWPSDTHVNFDANVNTTVNKLRQLLGDSNERSIHVQTIPRKGYCFISEVAFVEQPELASAADVPATQAAATVPTERESAPALDCGLFAAQRSRVWFTAGVIALTIAAMLLGAAITLFSYHHS
jgi:DNA-binding winged helix-turn-helix (wHTH) protein